MFRNQQLSDPSFHTRTTNRKRPSRYGSIHLDDEQEQVDGEGRIHGELDPWLVLDILLDLVGLLILGTEELIDQPILPGVVLFDALFVAFGMLNLDLLGRGIHSPVTTKVERICHPQRGRECVGSGSGGDGLGAILTRRGRGRRG